MKPNKMIQYIVLIIVAIIPLSAKPGDWRQIGKAGDWHDTIAACGLNGRIYTIESGGELYETDPETGLWKQIGKADYANTKFLFAVGDKLCTIEKDGSLYAIEPEDGAWIRVGKPGEWANTAMGIGFKGKLYTVESGGGLYVTEISTNKSAEVPAGSWRQIGDSDFEDTVWIFAVGNALCTIEKNGSLYAVNPSNGKWKQIGSAGEWRNTIIGTGMGKRLYTVESDGGLFSTDISTGKWKQIGNSDFKNTVFMISDENAIYTIEKDGSLYAIEGE